MGTPELEQLRRNLALLEGVLEIEPVSLSTTVREPDEKAIRKTTAKE
jgi:hypothetical protein